MKHLHLFILAIVLSFCACDFTANDVVYEHQEALFKDAKALVIASDHLGDFLYEDGKLVTLDEAEINLINRDVYPDPGDPNHDWQFYDDYYNYDNGRIYLIYWCQLCGDLYWVYVGDFRSVQYEEVSEAQGKMFEISATAHGIEVENKNIRIERVVIETESEPMVGSSIDFTDINIFAETLQTRDGLNFGECDEGHPPEYEHNWEFFGWRKWGTQVYQAFECTYCWDQYWVNVTNP